MFVLFVYQIVVANGEETVTANFNQVINANNENPITKCKYSLMQTYINSNGHVSTLKLVLEKFNSRPHAYSGTSESYQ